MSVERQLLVWAAMFGALIVTLLLLGSVVTPFAMGIGLGYLLDPIVKKLHRWGINRLVASLMILGLFILLLVVALVVGLPILATQLVSFAAHMPGYVEKLQSLTVSEWDDLTRRYGGEWLDSLGLSSTLTGQQIQKAVNDFVSRGSSWLVDNGRSLLSGGAQLLNFFSLLVITPVVAFYMLVDWTKMTNALDSLLPLEHRAALRAVAAEINVALAGFIRGQSLVCLLLGGWYGVGLTLIGLDFGFLIGVIGGMLSFVPYIGSLTVLVLSLIVSLVQGWPSLKLFFLALGVVGFGQFLESYVLSPKLVGESIGLHPVWLMFALLAFGELFGFTGLLVAVPMAAAIGVLVRHFVKIYRASPLYLGHTAEPAP